MKDKIIAVLALMIIASGLANRCAGGRIRKTEAERDRHATDALVLALKAESTEVRMGRQVNDVLKAHAAKDSTIAALSQKLKAAGAHALSRTEVKTESRGELVVLPVDNQPDSVKWEIRDPPMAADITVVPDTWELKMAWVVAHNLELVHVITPDNRLLVTARSPDPRIEVNVRAFEYALPKEQKRGFPFKLVGLSFGAGAVACLLWCN